MQGEFYICAMHEVSDPGCHEFSAPVKDGVLEGFVVHWRGEWFAYRNSCPHTGVNLNWRPHQFLDVEQRMVQCTLHGALFEPDTGLCIHGPCFGESLQRLPLVITGTSIYLEFAPATAPNRPKPL